MEHQEHGKSIKHDNGEEIMTTCTFTLKVDYDKEVLKKLYVELESAITSICRVNKVTVKQFKFKGDM